MLQTILPEHLTRLTDSETDTRIRDLKSRLGERLVILGHHYQRDEVIKFAETLEKVCVDVVESGRMTKDLAILIRADHPFLTTEEFLDAINAELKKKMGM